MDQATKLRERVQTNQEISNARVIAITSGKGGVGKTTLSVNIALELARRGKKVVVFDADFGLANVEVMLGIRPQYNLLDRKELDLSPVVRGCPSLRHSIMRVSNF